MMNGQPNWRRAEVFPESQDTLVLVLARRIGASRLYLAHWRWHRPWFKKPRKVWFGHYGIVRDAICYVPVGELLKLPSDFRTNAEIASDLGTSMNRQRASAVRGASFDVV